MGWGSKTTTDQTQQSQNTQTGSNTSTPNLPPWLMSAFQNNVGVGQNLVAQSQRPIVGDAQEAATLQQQNSQTNNSLAQLGSRLASTGQGQGGAYGAGVASILQGANATQANYLGQLPFQNAQAQQAQETNALGASSNVNRAVPFGTTSTSSSNGQSNSTSQSQTQQDPGIAGLVGSLLGIGLGGLMDGGGKGLLSAFGFGPSNPSPGSPYGAPQGPDLGITAQGQAMFAPTNLDALGMGFNGTPYGGYTPAGSYQPPAYGGY